MTEIYKTNLIYIYFLDQNANFIKWNQTELQKLYANTAKNIIIL